MTIGKDGHDYRVHYNDCSPERSTETVIMLHGSGPGASSWANFYRNIEPLTELGFRVILMDFPGWGKSDPIVCTGSRSDLNAYFLKGLIDRLDIETVHLVGNSMGAHSAVACALEHPQLIKTLTLMGGGTGGISPFFPMPTEGIKLIGALYRNPSVDNIRKMMEVFVFDASNLTDELYQLRYDNIMSQRVHLENFVKSQELNPRQFPDVNARLHEIEAETLIVWGRNDRFVPLDTGLRLVAGIRKSRMHIFNNCGHWAQWEHFSPFNRLVADFLKNHDI